MSQKEKAAIAAADLVESGMLVGLGTGSTAAIFVRELGRRMRDGTLRDIRGVPTSHATAWIAEEEGIPMIPLVEVDEIDLTVDGADEVDPHWNLIKGAGGSLLREKIVAQVSRLEAIVVDESKLVDRLGQRMALPLEVVPFGWSTHLEFLRSLGGDPRLRRDDDGPFLTDETNYTLDVRFPPEVLSDPHELNRKIRSRAGVIETGLFLDLTSILVVGRDSGIEISKDRPTP